MTTQTAADMEIEKMTRIKTILATGTEGDYITGESKAITPEQRTQLETKLKDGSTITTYWSQSLNCYVTIPE